MDSVLAFLIYFLEIFRGILLFLIFVRVLFSWIPNMKPNRFTEFIVDSTEPVLSIFKRFIPPLGMIDITPIVAYFVINYGVNLLIQFLITLS